MYEYIDEIVKSDRIVLFMKGIPTQPSCGFSASVVQILDSFGVAYKGVNILDDAELRADLKAYTNWPTFPQLYVDGEFIGGADIVREMFDDGELGALL